MTAAVPPDHPIRLGEIPAERCICTGDWPKHKTYGREPNRAERRLARKKGLTASKLYTITAHTIECQNAYFNDPARIPECDSPAATPKSPFGA